MEALRGFPTVRLGMVLFCSLLKWFRDYMGRGLEIAIYR